MIYRRFTEKSAEEWRQIYKALQLLEYLIKHGSERVIDDARSHITLLKMLRQFHYIDQNGKDQGVNVRHRAKELAELLSDVDRIRAERKKARANKGKFTSMQGGSGFGSGSRYGGFGSDSGYGGGSSSTYGGYSGGVYGDGGGFGGQSDEYRASQSRADKFEEYDEFDEGERPAASTTASKPTRDTAQRAGVKKSTEPPKKEPEVDLFEFDEPAPPATSAAPLAAPSAGSGLAALASGANDDDEFDDFQSAAPTTAPQASLTTSLPPPITAAASKPMPGSQQAGIGGIAAMSSISPPPSSISGLAGNSSAFSTPLTTTAPSPASQVPKPAGYQATTPNYFSSVPIAPSQQPANSAFGGPKPAGSPAVGKPAGSGDAFGALWSQASVGIKKNTTGGPGPAMGQLAKEKSSAGIWGAPAPSSAAKPADSSKPLGNGLDDLLG
jgi:epsin